MPDLADVGSRGFSSCLWLCRFKALSVHPQLFIYLLRLCYSMKYSADKKTDWRVDRKKLLQFRDVLFFATE